MNLREEYTKETGKEYATTLFGAKIYHEVYVEWLEAKYKESMEYKIRFHSEMTIIEEPRETEG